MVTIGSHLAVYFENQDGAGTEQALAALSDPLSQMFPVIDGDSLRIHPTYRYVSGAFVGLEATVETRARFVAEGLRRTYGQVFIPEINPGAEPASPPKFNDWRMNPLALDDGESLQLHTVNNPGAATDQFGVVWFSDGRIQPVDPSGGFWTRWVTAASALAVNTWGARALTPDTNLQTGRYEVLGMKAKSTSLIAARLAFPNQVNKPGVLGTDDEDDISHRVFEVPGQWGVLGAFHTNNPPTAEMLVDAADNEIQEFRLFVRRIGG